MRWAIVVPSVLLLAVAEVSCAPIRAQIQPSRCPVAPVSHSELPAGVDLRARIRFEIDERVVHLEVIARSSAEELVVAGIARYGLRMFAVRQRGRSIAVEDATTREHAHLARFAMDALHRSLWIYPPSATGIDPVLSWVWEDEQVTESGASGQRLREFSRLDASTRVSVQYHARSVEIRNPWCGYQATLVLVDDDGSRQVNGQVKDPVKEQANGELTGQQPHE